MKILTEMYVSLDNESHYILEAIRSGLWILTPDSDRIRLGGGLCPPIALVLHGFTYCGEMKW